MDILQFALLPTKPLSRLTPFVHTKEELHPVLLNDPAVSVMKDFTLQPPCATGENIPIQQALQQMKLLQVRSLFVINAEDRILGHISARDIQSPKAIALADQLQISPSEITVKMLMVPNSQMVALQFNLLSNTRVGHIARLFHELGMNYIFVVEQDKDRGEVVRGIFSISQVSKQLGDAMLGDLSSHTVAEMTHLI